MKQILLVDILAILRNNETIYPVSYTHLIYSNLGLSVCTVNIGFRPQAILRVTLSVDIVDRDIVRKRVEEAKEDETNSNSH